MNETIRTIIERRSIRSYEDRPVPDELLEQIVEAGRYAPSGSNMQDNHLFVIRGKEALEELVSLVQAAFAEMECEEGMYPAKKRAIESSRKGSYNFLYGAPVLVVVANRMDNPNAKANGSCVAENMMVAAKSLGIGSCWINQLWWLEDNPSIRQWMMEHGMGEDESVTCSVSLGYATEEPSKELPRTGNKVEYIN